jgi:cytochrome c biogenesis protein CcmG/thiol:disulfide interchange protein DsbE
MVMTIHLPTPGPDNTLLHACRGLAPDPSPLVGKPLPAVTFTQLDGTKLALAALKGKPALINLMATWDMLTKTERPTLATLATQFPTLAIVLLASDRDARHVATEIGPRQPFRVALDPPANLDENLGAVTTSLGIKALPESLLVDRKGIVRFHFQNARHWDEPEAQRCVKAFLAAP